MIVALAHQQNRLVVAEEPAGKAGQAVQPDGLGARNVSSSKGELHARIQNLGTLAPSTRSPWDPGALARQGSQDGLSHPGSPFPSC